MSGQKVKRIRGFSGVTWLFEWTCQPSRSLFAVPVKLRAIGIVFFKSGAPLHNLGHVVEFGVVLRDPVECFLKRHGTGDAVALDMITAQLR